MKDKMPECKNDDTYVHPSDPELTCKRIRNREHRRTLFCKEKEVSRLCPQSCGVCCKNDSTYTFMKGLIERNCAWVGNLEQSQKESWCSKHKGGHTIQDMCPVACDECKSYIPVVSSSPSSSSYLPSSGPSLYPSFEPTHDPSSSPTTRVRRSSVGGVSTGKSASTSEGKEILWIFFSAVIVAIGVFAYVSHRARLRSESKPDLDICTFVEEDLLEEEGEEVEWPEVSYGNDEKIGRSSSSSLTMEDEENAKQYDAKTDIDNVFDIDLRSMYRNNYTFEERGTDATDKYRSERETFDDDSVHSTTTDRYSVSGENENEKDEENMLHSEIENDKVSKVQSEIKKNIESTVQSEIKKDRESREKYRMSEMMDVLQSEEFPYNTESTETESINDEETVQSGNRACDENPSYEENLLQSDIDSIIDEILLKSEVYGESLLQSFQMDDDSLSQSTVTTDDESYSQSKPNTYSYDTLQSEAETDRESTLQSGIMSDEENILCKSRKGDGTDNCAQKCLPCCGKRNPSEDTD